MSDSSPKISIVTPSYNQSRYIENTIHSVLDQNYPNLEYIIIDGGSTDGTAEIIERFADRLAYRHSRPDDGMYDAINEGFSRSTGEIMAWINSDDVYFPWTLRIVGEIFRSFPEVDWLTTNMQFFIDRDGVPGSVAWRGLPEFTHPNWPEDPEEYGGFIQQESTFWRRSLWEKSGGCVDSSLRLAADYELWLRFARHARLHYIELPLGGFRTHSDQKTANLLKEYMAEAAGALRAQIGTGERYAVAKSYPVFRRPARRNEWSIVEVPVSDRVRLQGMPVCRARLGRYYSFVLKDTERKLPAVLRFAVNPIASIVRYAKLLVYPVYCKMKARGSGSG